MAKKYTAEELNNLSQESMVVIVLSMQDQLEKLNANMERLIEQIAVANNQRYGRSSEKMEVINEQLCMDFIFNEAEALMETLYVVGYRGFRNWKTRGVMQKLHPIVKSTWINTVIDTPLPVTKSAVATFSNPAEQVV